MRAANVLVSIIIPVHNKEKARICIEHIKRQTHQNIELIPVDFKGFTAEKRNYGYGKSKGSYVLFLDEDEYMTPATIEACLKKFNEGLDIVGIPQIKAIPKTYVEKCASILKENVAKPLFFRRCVLENVGLFRTKYVLCDDLDLLLRAFKAGYKLDIIDVKDGYILHDETNSLTSLVQKTLWGKKSYRELQAEYGTGLDVLTRKPSQRRRIMRLLNKQAALIPGTLLIMCILFVARRMP